MAKMFSSFFFKSLFIFWYRFLLRQLKNLLGFHRSIATNVFPSQFKYQKYHSLAHRSDLSDHTLIFDVEGALLKSSDLFPYFMLVAFEAGGLIRAIVLILLYPMVCLAEPGMGLNIMVAICFFGIKAKNFRVGRAVLPKLFLENVGSEIFEILNRGGKKVGVTNLPQVMVDSFLREYLEINYVVGRQLKVFCGYYVGLMEDKRIDVSHALDQVCEGKGCHNTIGICRFNKSLDPELLSYCEEVYLVTEAERRSWKILPREKYPKALIFHDGRLAMRPTPMNAAATLIWLPYAIILAIIRITMALSLPYPISTPLLSITGLRMTSSMPQEHEDHDHNNNSNKNKKHRLYVCNHRTLLDPLYLSFALRRNLIAVTYSLSRMSEILAPIKTVRLTRDRDEDAKMMKRLLKEGDLAVCPEGTTCREAYLLRFSPLFSEMCDQISPVAVDCHVSMFHGTTAGGLKCLDPFFFLMNPSPIYSLHFLPSVSSSTCVGRFQVANHVQSQIGDALGFECTMLTRKDKYLILAGNDGLVSSPNTHHVISNQS